MKFICSVVFALLACQAVLGNIVPRSDAEDENQECINALFERLAENVRTQFYEIRENVDNVKSIYDNCQSLPYAERQECLVNFSQIFIGEAQRGISNVQERRDNFTLYGLARLTEYNTCRVNQGSNIEANPARESLCAVRFFENFDDEFAPQIEGVANVWYRMTYQFLQCYIGSQDYQPRCFMDLALQARDHLNNFISYLVVNRESQFASFEHLVSNYYQCRLGYPTNPTAAPL